jgi:hypothetical protein
MSVRTVHRVEVSVREEVVAIQCNVCGKERTAAEHGVHEFTEDMHTIALGGGWGDQYPGDLQTIRFVTCGDCLFAWTQTFKVPVESTHDICPSSEPLQATHSETGAAWVVEALWAYPEGSVLPEPLDAEMPEGEYPASGVWEHFKGRKYEVLRCVLAKQVTPEILVVYRALYEDSKMFVRPLSMWRDEVPQEPTGRLIQRFRPLF